MISVSGLLRASAKSLAAINSKRSPIKIIKNTNNSAEIQSKINKPYIQTTPDEHLGQKPIKF